MKIGSHVVIPFWRILSWGRKWYKNGKMKKKLKKQIVKKQKINENNQINKQIAKKNDD